jgi:hypothetical protein
VVWFSSEGNKEYAIDLKVDSYIIDEEVTKRISDLESLRNEFHELLKIIGKYHKEGFLLLHKFFNNYLQFIRLKNKDIFPSGTFGAMKNDHYYFFILEIFLFSVTYLLEMEYFEELSYILHTPYLVNDSGDYKSYSFTALSLNPLSLNKYRIERLNLNIINGISKLLRDRLAPFYDENTIMQTDALLYYISCLMATNNLNFKYWFPYSCDGFLDIPSVFQKLKSLSYFSKFRTVLDVKDKEELIQKVDAIIENEIDKLSRFYYEIPLIQDVINSDLIGRIP